jgi:cytochrome b subunit of formate dehydrogenase
MEWVRVALNPWGEEIVLGLAWNTAWLVVIAGAIFIVGHAFFARKREGQEAGVVVDPGVAAAVPPHVTRHNKSARISHWILAASVLALLITAFVPMLGLQFPWLTIHWVSGLVLGVYFVYHILDSLVRLSWGKMWIGWRDIADSFGRLKSFLSRGEEDPSKRPGKWGIENKIFHHVTALAGIAVLATGLLMMTRIDTWFWAANPYALEISDADWGIVYVIHGVAAVAFVGLIMAHIYFAVRPDKFFLTKSMVFGWITKDDYLTHYDPRRWRLSKNGVAPQPRREEAVAAGSSSSHAPRD